MGEKKTHKRLLIAKTGEQRQTHSLVRRGSLHRWIASPPIEQKFQPCASSRTCYSAASSTRSFIEPAVFQTSVAVPPTRSPSAEANFTRHRETRDCCRQSLKPCPLPGCPSREPVGAVARRVPSGQRVREAPLFRSRSCGKRMVFDGFAKEPFVASPPRESLRRANTPVHQPMNSERKAPSASLLPPPIDIHDMSVAAPYLPFPPCP